jgi:hypothetical protein
MIFFGDEVESVLRQLLRHPDTAASANSSAQLLALALASFPQISYVLDSSSYIWGISVWDTWASIEFCS